MSISQRTIPNIPLRNLFYVAEEYQKLVVKKSLYSTAIQKIPTPRFIVFYNGTQEVEDYSEFRLSSAYEKPTKDSDLELKFTSTGSAWRMYGYDVWIDHV